MTVQYYRRRKKVNGAYIDIVPDIARYAEGLADSTRAVMLANIVLKEEIDSSLLLSENRTIGSISQPVYLDKGIITACTDIPSKSSANTFQNTNTFSGSLIVGNYNVGDKIKHFDDDITDIYNDLTNVVHRTTTETISGAKTFSNSIYMADRVIQFNTGRTGNCIHVQDRNITARATPPSSTTYTYPIVYKGQDGSVVGDMVMGFNSGGQSYTQLENYDKDGAVKSIILNLTGNPTANTVVTRADVFGTNQVDNNLVHTIGDERQIEGQKTFWLPVERRINFSLDVVPSAYVHYDGLKLLDNQLKLATSVAHGRTSTAEIAELQVNKGNAYAKLGLRLSSDGNITIVLEGNTSKGYKQTTLHSLW